MQQQQLIAGIWEMHIRSACSEILFLFNKAVFIAVLFIDGPNVK
jgi:hypothetical protein